jgi:hypothetical protein
VGTEVEVEGDAEEGAGDEEGVGDEEEELEKGGEEGSVEVTGGLVEEKDLK